MRWVTAWLIWVLIAGLSAVGEVLSLALVLAMVAVGALAAAVVAAAGGGLALELVVFVLVSAALLLLVRPLARRSLRRSPRLRTGTAALVGRGAVVLERVDAEGGRIKVAGEVWSARAWDEHQVFETGARVEVMEIEGATALVHE
jgi:membrane protein implicated in regulation of membrane protease activity